MSIAHMTILVVTAKSDGSGRSDIQIGTVDIQIAAVIQFACFCFYNRDNLQYFPGKREASTGSKEWVARGTFTREPSQ